jgi:hypothetical protein
MVWPSAFSGDPRQEHVRRGLLPHGAASPITPEAMAVYRAPFATRESRRPTLAFPRVIPIGVEPADVHGQKNSYLPYSGSAPGFEASLMVSWKLVPKDYEVTND